MNKYIGPNKIKEVKTTEDKTPSGIEILKIEYENGKSETLSKVMYDEIVSDTSCDLTELRDKRVRPVVASILLLMREWGIKIGENAYLSALLNQSLENNKIEAEKELWLKYIPTLNSLDDVNYLAVDAVLKTKKNEPIPSPYKDESK